VCCGGGRAHTPLAKVHFSDVAKVTLTNTVHADPLVHIVSARKLAVVVRHCVFSVVVGRDVVRIVVIAVGRVAGLWREQRLSSLRCYCDVTESPLVEQLDRVGCLDHFHKLTLRLLARVVEARRAANCFPELGRA
jgi:hypothetical protein